MKQKAEENYPENQQNPGPSQESLDEPNDKKAGINVNWTIIIAVIILIVAFFLIFGTSYSS